MLPSLSTSTIPKLFRIHLNQDLIVLALLSRVEPVRDDFSFSNLMMSCFVITLLWSLDISINILFIIGNSSSNLQMKAAFFSVGSLRYLCAMSVSSYLPVCFFINPKVSDACL